MGKPILAVCIPVYNDWASAIELIQRLAQVLSKKPWEQKLLLVDDGSTEPIPTANFRSLRDISQSVEILRLRRNIGHQRAIAIGLSYIYVNWRCRAVVVMDGDGEDGPEDVARLMDKLNDCQDRKIVFARRARRVEGLIWKFFYYCYKLIHYLLTGRKINVGNFSIIPFSLLSRIVGISEIWNHYAAAVFKANLPVDSIPIDRSPRIAGRSQMNFTALVIHGLSALSVYSELIGVRMICVMAVSNIMLLIAGIVVVVIKWFTYLAIPGWATSAMGLVLLLFGISSLLSIVFVFLTLHWRSISTFLPLRDYQYYVLERVDFK